MAQLTIQVNGRPYLVGCEDGQEAHLRELAKLFDAQVQQLAGSVGSLGETKLFLMGALMMADDLADTRARLSLAQAETIKLREDLKTVEDRAGAALDAAAQRIEALANAAQPTGMLM